MPVGIVISGEILVDAAAVDEVGGARDGIDRGCGVLGDEFFGSGFPRGGGFHGSFFRDNFFGRFFRSHNETGMCGWIQHV